MSGRLLHPSGVAMPLSPQDPFVVSLQESGILPQRQWALLSRDLERGVFPDLSALIDRLVQRGWLTEYQVNELQRGRGRELVLDRYIVREMIGQGGMARVFKAVHSHSQRTVALKLIREDHPHASLFRARLC